MFEPISSEEFEERVHLSFARRPRTPLTLVSLRDIDPTTIESLEVMPRAYLEALLRNIPLEGNSEVKPYANCEITLVRMDPHDLTIGQTFVERGKYQALLEVFPNLFDGAFCVSRGSAKCNALIVFGQTRNGVPAVAHYLPPFVESSNTSRFLVDGIHRNFLVMRVGTTIESIMIKGVTEPLPCDAVSWGTIKTVDAKPPRGERFHNLQPARFRNLKFVGIDG